MLKIMRRHDMKNTLKEYYAGKIELKSPSQRWLLQWWINENNKKAAHLIMTDARASPSNWQKFHKDMLLENRTDENTSNCIRFRLWHYSINISDRIHKAWRIFTKSITWEITKAMTDKHSIMPIHWNFIW